MHFRGILLCIQYAVLRQGPCACIRRQPCREGTLLLPIGLPSFYCMSTTPGGFEFIEEMDGTQKAGQGKQVLWSCPSPLAPGCRVQKHNAVALTRAAPHGASRTTPPSLLHCGVHQEREENQSVANMGVRRGGSTLSWHGDNAIAESWGSPGRGWRASITRSTGRQRTKFFFFFTEVRC